MHGCERTAALFSYHGFGALAHLRSKGTYLGLYLAAYGGHPVWLTHLDLLPSRPAYDVFDASYSLLSPQTTPYACH